MPEHPHCPIPELTPLSCAIALGEFVRAEVGKRGVQEYVQCMGHFLPWDTCEHLARRLQCDPPKRLPPPPHGGIPHEHDEHAHHPHEAPKKKDMSMEQMMQMMQMMQAFKK